MARLNARAILIKQRTTGVDPLVDRILSETGEEEMKSLYEQAKEISASRLKKRYVESCLIAERDLTKVSDLLEIPSPVLEVYKKIYFNVENFDKLSLLEIVDQASDADERGMKMWALSQGLDFISWRLGKTVDINPVEGLKELFTLSVFKSKEALFSGNTSESSKEATKWTKLSMDLARLLKVWVMDSEAARRDIELALKTIDPEFEGLDSLQ